MANQKLFEVTSGDGTAIFIEYNDANLRVGNITFEVPVGKLAQVYLWNDGVLVYDQLYAAGPHSENVPGNYRVVEYVDPDDGLTYAYLPPEIAWSFSEIRI